MSLKEKRTGPGMAETEQELISLENLLEEYQTNEFTAVPMEKRCSSEGLDSVEGICDQIVRALPRLYCAPQMTLLPDGLIIIQSNKPLQRDIPRPPDRTKVYPFWEHPIRGMAIAYGDKYRQVAYIPDEELIPAFENPRYMTRIGDREIPKCRPTRAWVGVFSENLVLLTVGNPFVTTGIAPLPGMTSEKRRAIWERGLPQAAIVRDQIYQFVGGDIALNTRCRGEDFTPETTLTYNLPELCCANLVWLAQGVEAASGTKITQPFTERAAEAIMKAQTHYIQRAAPGTDIPDKTTDGKNHEAWKMFVLEYLDKLSQAVRVPLEISEPLRQTYDDLLAR